MCFTVFIQFVKVLGRVLSYKRLSILASETKSRVSEITGERILNSTTDFHQSIKKSKFIFVTSRISYFQNISLLQIIFSKLESIFLCEIQAS